MILQLRQWFRLIWELCAQRRPVSSGVKWGTCGVHTLPLHASDVTKTKFVSCTRCQALCSRDASVESKHTAVSVAGIRSSSLFRLFPPHPCQVRCCRSLILAWWLRPPTRPWRRSWCPGNPPEPGWAAATAAAGSCYRRRPGRPWWTEEKRQITRCEWVNEK